MNGTEIWNPIPSTPGTEASSRGQIKMFDMVVLGKNGKERLIKGGIRQQRNDKDGYKKVDVFYDGKWHTKMVHRLVAEAFLPNPDNLPQVNHKNCIRDDNHVNNLEWCDNSYNMKYREKYGVSNAESLGHPLFAVNLETREVSQFRSQREAEQETGVANQDINKVLKSKRQQAGGFYFTENESKITKRQLREIKANMQHRGGVIAVNLETQAVLYFESKMKAERQLGANHSSISAVLKGRYKQTGNYWFCYADSNAVESTRSKFGNEIANKVGELLGGKEL